MDEPNPNSPETMASAAALEQALAEFLPAIERGEHPNREELLANWND